MSTLWQSVVDVMDLTSLAGAILPLITSAVQGLANIAKGMGSIIFPEAPVVGIFIMAIILLYMMKNNLSGWWTLAIIAGLVAVLASISSP